MPLVIRPFRSKDGRRVLVFPADEQFTDIVRESSFDRTGPFSFIVIDPSDYRLVFTVGETVFEKDYAEIKTKWDPEEAP